MNITPVIKLATAYVAFSISAYAVEVFSVTTSPTFPTQNSATFLGSDYDIYGTTDSGNGSGWGSGITANFNGDTPWTTEVNGVTKNWISVVSPGDQFTSPGNNASTTTYYGPTFYAGLNRDQYKGSAGVIHSSGNGYRIRVNNITASDIETNGGNDINFKAVFLFDADLSVLGENENLRFGPTDTLDAKFTVPRNLGLGTTTSVSSISVESGGTFDGSGGVSIEFSDPDMEGGAVPTAEVVMNGDNTAVESVTITPATAGTGYLSVPTVTFVGGGVSVQPSTTVTLVTASPGVTNGRASMAACRPMIKAGDEYYAGPLHTTDLSAIETAGINSHVYSISLAAGGDTVWTLMPNMERTNNALQTHPSHPQNLTVISDGTETTVAGSLIENITQVGFMIETNATVNTGGYNLGIREFIANATPGGDADGDGVVDAEDVHPGFNDAALTTYLNDNNYIVDDGSGGGGDGSGGLSEQDIIDLRAGSTLIDASDGSAAITIQLEQSTDITDPSAWTDMGSEGQATVTVPMSGDTTFFRVRAQ